MAKRNKEEPVEVIGSPTRLREVLCRYKTVIVLFTSPTCPACQLLRPIFYAYAEWVLGRLGPKSRENIKFIEINVYELYEEAIALGIMATPTVLVFQSCRPVDGFQGMVGPEDLAEFLANYIPIELSSGARSSFADYFYGYFSAIMRTLQ